jgi:hypothetical protein
MTAIGDESSTARSLLDLRHQDRWFRHSVVRPVFVAMAVALITGQQFSFLRLADSPDPFYRNVLNLGASYQRYFSLFYYFGAFPVNLERQNTSTLEETTATLQRVGKSLVPERSVYNRASIFLFYPDAFMRGRPDTAEMRTGHALWFTVALLALFGALCYRGMPLFGLVVALLCGSDAFQVWELYHLGSSTIFPTVISTGLAIAAAAILLSNERFARHRMLPLLLVCVCGGVGALQYEIRLEGVGIFAGALFSLAICCPQSIVRKLLFVVVFAASAMAVSSTMNWYFTRSFEKANAIVVQYGGTPTDSGNAYYSTEWWALWSGLGDFDEKYGFLADDRAGLSYYYGHDAAAPSEQVQRRNYLDTIREDPVWFARILRDRLMRVLVENTPYRIAFGSRYVDLKLSPRLVTLMGLILLVANLVARRWENLSLFVLPLSVGAVAVGQLADYGLQFYAVAHLFILAYVVCFALDVALLVAGRATRPLTRRAPSGRA